MQINSLSTLHEIHMNGTQIGSAAVKGDMKLPNEWHFIVSSL